MSYKEKSQKRADDFKSELVALMKKHNASFNLDLVENGVDFSFDINPGMNPNDSYNNRLVNFQSGEVYPSDII